LKRVPPTTPGAIQSQAETRPVDSDLHEEGFWAAWHDFGKNPPCMATSDTQFLFFKFPATQLIVNEIGLESLEPGLFTTRVAVPA